MNVAHTDQNEYVIATQANMEEYAAKELGGRVVACSPDTGEQCSATPGDYFALGSDEHLEDSEGNPMVLALVKPERAEPIRRITVPGEDDPGKVSDAAVGTFVRECVLRGWTSVEIGRAARKLTA